MLLKPKIIDGEICLWVEYNLQGGWGNWGCLHLIIRRLSDDRRDSERRSLDMGADFIILGCTVQYVEAIMLV